jgi:hypothetical protein
MSEQTNEPMTTIEPITPETSSATVTTKPRLDSKGIVILFLTTILSLIFIISGIFVSVNNNDTSSRGGSSRNSSSSRSSSSSYSPGSSNSTFSLSLNSARERSTERYEYYTYTFYAASAGYYYVCINGGSMTSIEDSDGISASKQNSSQAGYDNSYRVYLFGYETYTIQVYSSSTSLFVLIKQ